MSFGALRRRLKALINRKDFSDDLAGDFVRSAITDLERDLRIPAMEKLADNDTWDGTKNFWMVPGDMIEPIAMFTDTAQLRKCSLEQFIAAADQTGSPSMFVRVGRRYLLRPTPQKGAVVYFNYFGASTPLQASQDYNVWTKAGFNAVLYTAAALAADFYQMEDEYAARFTSKAQAYSAAIVEQTIAERWADPMAVAPPSDLGTY